MELHELYISLVQPQLSMYILLIKIHRVQEVRQLYTSQIQPQFSMYIQLPVTETTVIDIIINIESSPGQFSLN